VGVWALARVLLVIRPRVLILLVTRLRVLRFAFGLRDGGVKRVGMVGWCERAG
jgi:hypothetical protein